MAFLRIKYHAKEANRVIYGHKDVEEFVESVLAASEQRIKELDEKADKAVQQALSELRDEIMEWFDKNMYEEDHYSSQRPRPLIVRLLRADDTLKEVLKAIDSRRTVEG